MQTKPLFGNRMKHDTRRANKDGHTPQFPAKHDGDLDGVRWEKVLTLKAAIACGRYNISSEALARRLMMELFPGIFHDAPQR